MDSDQAQILIVEDDPGVAELLETLFQETGYAASSVATGVAALEYVKQRRPDLILLDVMLPEMDGFEVLHRLRQREATTHLPVIMLTALSNPEEVVRGITGGADDYVTKPFNHAELLSRISLRLTQAQRENTQRAAAVRAGLQAIAHAVAAPDTVAALVARVADLTQTITESATCGILLWNEAERCLEPAGCVGLEPESRRRFNALRLPLGISPLVDQLVTERRPFTVQGSSTIPALDLFQLFQKEIVLVAPMLYHDRLYGMLIIGRNTAGKEFAEDDLDLISSLANQAALALANQRAVERLERMATTDYLTGLYNPRYFHESLQQQLARARRTGEPTGLLMLDLDHFKRVNDTHGHQAGDATLVAVAGALRDSLRDSDVAVRYGGEELVAVLPDADWQAAFQVAERVHEAINALRVDAGTTELRITASIGVAAARRGGAGARALVRAADRALYEAKEAGRNCIRPLVQRSPAAGNGPS